MYINIGTENNVFVLDAKPAFAAATAACFAKIPIAHIHGGERSEGAYDESIRHAITKFSHLHFVSNKDSLQRVIRLGELKKSVFNVGCPRIDLVKKSLNQKLNKSINKQTLLDNYTKFLCIISPIIPHFSSECLEDLKLKPFQKWPEVDRNLIQIRDQCQGYW